jgi:hypothetical protein
MTANSGNTRNTQIQIYEKQILTTSDNKVKINMDVNTNLTPQTRQNNSTENQDTTKTV